MPRQPIDIKDLQLQPFTTFDPEGVLLVCGAPPAKPNPMTISWGSFGIMWGKPILMVMVRPTRYTYSLIMDAADFTVNWLPPKWADAVRLCGSASGRELDKFTKTGLHPTQASAVKTPIIDESDLVFECRMAYRSALDPKLFVNEELLKCYNQSAADYHGLFFGEVMALGGTDAFRKR